MKNYQKAFLSSVCFIISFFIVLVSIVEIYFASDSQSWSDRKCRKELSGEIDCIFNGSCHSVYGINPLIIDEKMNVNSYNLSGPEVNWYERKYLIEDMLSKNPIKTIYFEIAYDNLGRDIDESFWGTVYFLSRTESVLDQVSAFFCYTKFNEYDDAAKFLIKESFEYAFASFENMCTKLVNNIFNLDLKYHQTNHYKKENKGYIPYDAENMTFSHQEVEEKYNSIAIDYDTNIETLNIIDDVMALCKEKNIYVYFIVLPISTNKLWEVNNFDEFRITINSLAQKYDCRCFDFNLLKNYSSLFSIDNSFHDDFHLSDLGTTAFCEEMCDIIIESSSGKDVSSRFFDTYAEAKEYSEYMNILKGD